MYILVDGMPVEEHDTLKWGQWMETAERVLWKTHCFEGGRVSTVFLGLDHNLWGNRPVLYETMVFGGPLDQEIDRYSTFEEAKAGHGAMVDRCKAHAR